MSILLLGLSVGSIAGLSLAPTIIARWDTRRGLFMSLGLTALGLLLTGVATDTYPSLAGGCAALAVFGFANGSTDVLMNVEGTRAEKAIGQTRLPLMHGFFSVGTIVGALLGALASALTVPVSIHLSAMAAVTMVVGGLAVARLPRSDTAELPAAETGEPSTDLGGGWFDVRLLFVGIILRRSSIRRRRGQRLDIAGSCRRSRIHQRRRRLHLRLLRRGHDRRTAGRRSAAGQVQRGRRPGRACRRRHRRSGSDDPRHGSRSGRRRNPAVGAGLSLGFPVCISTAADHPTHAARRVSAVSICGYATFLVGPPAIGFIGEHSGILSALWLVAAALAIALLCTPAIRRPSGRIECK